jgi:hypothetical protein
LAACALDLRESNVYEDSVQGVIVEIDAADLEMNEEFELQLSEESEEEA